MTETLKERMEALRKSTDYVLPRKKYVMVMCDGRSFSKLIKNNYEKPFDDVFINMMNETAKYVCKNVQGCKFAYVQSDEMTFVLTDFDSDEEEASAFFGYRLCKMQSIIPSLATAKFNQLVTLNVLDTPCSLKDKKQIIANTQLIQFDCKAWSVDNFNDVYSFYLWRQIDCIRNSKTQTAQTYLTHKQLLNKTANEQIEMLLDEKGIDWQDYDDGKKYGRFIYKENVVNTNEKGEEFTRGKWVTHNAFPINGAEGKEKFIQLNKIPKID